MGTKQLKLLLAVLAVLVLAAVMLKLVRRSSIEAPMAGVGKKVLADFPINDVSEIVMTGPKGALTLKRGEGEGNLWAVAERDGYRADFGRISGLLQEVWGLKVAQAVEAGASQFGRLGLLDPGAEGEEETRRGTRVEFKTSAGQAAASLLVGKEYKRESDTPSPFGGDSSVTAGRYLMAGDSEKVWLVAEPLSSVDPSPADWISKDFFKVEKLASIERRSRSKHDDWKLARESESSEWKLLPTNPGEELDDTKIGSIKSAFSGPRFDDVATGVEPLGDEATEFVLNTFDGFEYSVRVGKELEDRKHHLSVAVKADFPSERKAEEGESEEDKKKKDEEFATERERLKKKLGAEQALAGRVFIVPNYVASPLLKKRLEITKAPAPPAEPGKDGEAKDGAPPAGAGAEAGAKATGAAPKATGAAPKATAVTEPIKVELPPAADKKAAPPKGEAPAKAEPPAKAEAPPKSGAK